MNNNMLENFQLITKALSEKTQSLKDAPCPGVPFGHTGTCDQCGSTVPYNDRIAWATRPVGHTERKDEQVLCLWCSAHHHDPNVVMSKENTLRLITHLIHLMP